MKIVEYAIIGVDEGAVCEVDGVLVGDHEFCWRCELLFGEGHLAKRVEGVGHCDWCERDVKSDRSVKRKWRKNT